MRYDFDKIQASYISEINELNFEEIALALFRFQYTNNEIYKAYVNALHINIENVNTLSKVPFLPISFFKTHKIVSGSGQAHFVFESSGTTGEQTSRHYVTNRLLYEQSLLKGFEKFYGEPEQYVLLALLPSYLGRKNASLVHMAKTLIDKTRKPESGFYLDNFSDLSKVLQELEQRKQKTLMLGVTFALLDFSASYPMKLQHTIVMETGGMKGRKRELTRTEVHNFLKQQWQLKKIHAEYGMTELLSQAYSPGEGIFQSSNTMKVFVRDMNDPFEISNHGAGVLNIIDLSNVFSCAFIATEDIAKLYADGSFEVLGRMDYAALRGCSLMTV